ncbi:hypothetical protein LCGC14_3053590, partial [marine sediment metagenome]
YRHRVDEKLRSEGPFFHFKGSFILAPLILFYINRDHIIKNKY